MPVHPSSWPGAPRQWDLRSVPGAGSSADGGEPLAEQPVDARVVALVLGLVVLVALALAVAPPVGADAGVADPTTVGVTG